MLYYLSFFTDSVISFPSYSYSFSLFSPSSLFMFAFWVILSSLPVSLSILLSLAHSSSFHVCKSYLFVFYSISISCLLLLLLSLLNLFPCISTVPMCFPSTSSRTPSTPSLVSLSPFSWAPSFLCSPVSDMQVCQVKRKNFVLIDFMEGFREVGWLRNN